MLEKIAAMLEEQLGTIGAGEITEDTSFQEDLGADSLDLFELMMQCEEEYGIELPADDLTDVKTVGDLIRLLKEQGIEV